PCDTRSFPTRRSSDLLLHQFRMPQYIAQRVEQGVGIRIDDRQPFRKGGNEIVPNVGYDRLAERHRFAAQQSVRSATNLIDYEIRSEEHTSELQSRENL